MGRGSGENITIEGGSVVLQAGSVVDVNSSALPTGASTEATLSALNTKVTAVDTTGKATEAKQDVANTSLASIDGKLPVSGIATEAKQDTGNSSLSSIDGKVATETTLSALNAKITSVDTGNVMSKITGATSGNIAEVDASNRLLVSTATASPPASTPVIQRAFSSMAGTSDLFYVITNGKTLTIQRLRSGSETGTGGSVGELYEDPTGTGTPLNSIGRIYSNGSSNQVDISEDFVGNGTRRILLRRRALGGGAREISTTWTGFET